MGKSPARVPNSCGPRSLGRGREISARSGDGFRAAELPVPPGCPGVPHEPEACWGAGFAQGGHVAPPAQGWAGRRAAETCLITAFSFFFLFPLSFWEPQVERRGQRDPSPKAPGGDEEVERGFVGTEGDGEIHPWWFLFSPPCSFPSCTVPAPRAPAFSLEFTPKRGLDLKQPAGCSAPFWPRQQPPAPGQPKP